MRLMSVMRWDVMHSGSNPMAKTNDKGRWRLREDVGISRVCVSRDRRTTCSRCLRYVSRHVFSISAMKRVRQSKPLALMRKHLTSDTPIALKRPKDSRNQV